MLPFRRLRVSTPDLFQRRLRDLGLMEAGPDGAPYWNTDAAYALAPQVSLKWLHAADAVHEMCLKAIDALISARDYAPFGIESPAMITAIERSWHARETTFIGRMDFTLGADGVPKLLDYEADGPVCLPEASYLQWEWFEAWKQTGGKGHVDQENLIYEKLISMWKKVPLGGRVCIASGGDADGDGNPLDTAERFTAEYLAETAREVGIEPHLCGIGQVGWDTEALRFTDGEDKVLEILVKLYPWQWMEQEPNAEALPLSKTRFLPQPWTRLLADKALLAVLWRMFPDSPHLLPAALEAGALRVPAVAKPRRGWDGLGVSLPGEPTATDAGPLVWQAHCPLPVLDGVHAAPSVWMVDGEAAGLSFRESRAPITRIDARFVPHLLSAP
jgi:glutathionylspermidine synthase